MVIAVLLGLASSLMLLLVAFSPVIMARLIKLPVEWDKLGNVGEAYGGTSAILSGLALGGIAVSLLLQWRQNKATLFLDMKQRHFDLVKLSLDNPKYLFVEGDAAASDPAGSLKAYANLTFSHWAMAWDVGVMPEPIVRSNAARLFRQQVVREWWAEWGSSYLSSRRRRHFVRIVNEEYAKARAAGSATSLTKHRPLTDPTSRPPRPALIAAVAVGLLFGALICRRIRRSVHIRRRAVVRRPSR